MRELLAILLCAVAFAASADTNDLERAKAAYLEARRAYMEARKAAGLTNAAPRKVATSKTATVLTKSQKRFFENRRICVGRDTTTIPGSVITTWYRNGRPDTKGPAVVTNVLHSITGTVQNNPLQGRIAELARRAARQGPVADDEGDLPGNHRQAGRTAGGQLTCAIGNQTSTA